MSQKKRMHEKIEGVRFTINITCAVPRAYINNKERKNCQLHLKVRQFWLEKAALERWDCHRAHVVPSTTSLTRHE